MLNSYEAFAYFTARLMYYINLNIENDIEYITENKNLYRGVKMPYSQYYHILEKKEK